MARPSRNKRVVDYAQFQESDDADEEYEGDSERPKKATKQSDESRIKDHKKDFSDDDNDYGEEEEDDDGGDSDYETKKISKGRQATAKRKRPADDSDDDEKVVRKKGRQVRQAATVAMAVSGLAMGIIDTIANIQLVVLYQKDSAIFLQALHFFIGFGALVSPLIADPFLSEHCPSMNSTEDESIMHHFRHSLTGLGSPMILNHSEHSGGVTEQSNVSYAFWIMALINLPVPIAVLVLMYCEKLLPCCPDGPPHLLNKNDLAMKTTQSECTPETQEQEAGGHGDPFSCCMNNNLCELPASFFGVHILGGLVLFMTDGIVGAYAGFAYTYAVSAPMSLNAKTAGYLPCIFWAAITGGRLISIPLTCRVRPVYLLMFNLVGVIVTVLLLLIYSTSSTFLFIGTCLLGLFLSSIFPCMLAYTEDILDYQGTSQKTAMVKQPEKVVATCEVPEREEEKGIENTDEKISEKIEKEAEENYEKKSQSHSSKQDKSGRDRRENGLRRTVSWQRAVQSFQISGLFSLTLLLHWLSDHYCKS
ncbi:major facilitator superfamily domain-containing protein 4A [Clarias magur]|uniref:Major facilitator superfamily domain-containing protein 4A n=1 Tax=Clarias magur TaxID=1594786 RepID=A0A8J4URH8_CLAMG|nr:major facilitator superfamily domain-containing protein 4A [Clarias magur]